MRSPLGRGWRRRSSHPNGTWRRVCPLQRFLGCGFLIFLSFQAAWALSPAAPAPLEYQVEAKDEENFAYAAAQLWVPPGTSEVRGILCIVLHPLDDGGSVLRDPEPWISVAERAHCALLAISFAQSTDRTKAWCKPELGSGQALLYVLDGLAGKSGITNLKVAPITMVGVCAAGQFAYEMAALFPQRLAAFVTIGGGMHNLHYARQAATTRGMLVTCGDRGNSGVKNIEALFAAGKAFTAPWQLRSETMARYDAGYCSAEVARFILDALQPSGDLSSQDVRPVLPKNEGDPAGYVSLPFPGKKLPPLGTVEPNPIGVGTLDRDHFLVKAGQFSLLVHRDAQCSADSLEIDDPCVTAEVQRMDNDAWQVNCTLKPESIPLGGFSHEVPIRFLRSGSPLLGEVRASVVGTMNGDISLTPRALNLGVVNANNVVEAKLQVASRAGKPLFLLTDISTSQSWVTARVKRLDSCSVELKCDFKPPAELRGGGFGGFLQLCCKTGNKYNLRIYYYGLVKKG